MFAAATSFFARTNISQNYNIGSASAGGLSSTLSSGLSAVAAAGGSRASTPGPSTASTSAGPPAVALTPTFRVGPWRVQAATHKSTGKRVSVWDCDKRSQWMERLNPAARDRALEVLKAEVRAMLVCALRGLTEGVCAGFRAGQTPASVYSRCVRCMVTLGSVLMASIQRWWNR